MGSRIHQPESRTAGRPPRGRAGRRMHLVLDEENAEFLNALAFAKRRSLSDQANLIIAEARERAESEADAGG